MSVMIDTHCHLNDVSYDNDIHLVIKEATIAGVKQIIVPTTKQEEFAKTIAIAEQNENVYCAIGVHPHYATNFNEDTCKKIIELSKHNKVVAIGEIGLDYYYDYSDRKHQLIAFEKQCELAEKLNLPVIIHSRDSDTDMLEELNKYFSKTSTIKGVLHCYSCGIDIIEDLLNMKLYFSFTANITFNNRKEFYDEVINKIPIEKIMIETDSPYMTPAPNRGKRNHPKLVKIVAERISKIKNINIEEVLTMTTQNAKEFFNIPKLNISKIVTTFILAFLFSSYFSLAQEDMDTEEDYYYEDEIDMPDNYNRVFGIGPIFGTNTIVDRYTTAPQSFSNEGIFSMGGMMNYRFLENFIIQGAFTYSKNMYYVNNMPDSTKHMLDPNYHKAVELSFIAMAKPRNMVNFYASVGGTYFMNDLSRNKNDGKGRYWKEYQYETILGMNAGVGGFVNISLGSIGTFTIYAEWKLNFAITPVKLDYDPRVHPDTPNYNVPTEYTSMYSIPRGGIIWYVPWLKN